MVVKWVMRVSGLEPKTLPGPAPVLHDKALHVEACVTLPEQDLEPCQHFALLLLGAQQGSKSCSGKVTQASTCNALSSSLSQPVSA